MNFTEEQLERLLENATPGTAFHYFIRTALSSRRVNTRKCPCCGKTENLIHGNTISMCQDAAREQLSDKE